MVPNAAITNMQAIQHVRGDSTKPGSNKSIQMFRPSTTNYATSTDNALKQTSVLQRSVMYIKFNWAWLSYWICGVFSCLSSHSTKVYKVSNETPNNACISHPPRRIERHGPHKHYTRRCIPTTQLTFMLRSDPQLLENTRIIPEHARGFSRSSEISASTS